MNIEFHYYINKIIALEAGFDEDDAETIAYSSQFVDDNVFPFLVRYDDDDEQFENLVTQTLDINNPDKKIIKRNLFFHYVPGDPSAYRAKRRDGKMHLLMTTPGSNNSLLLLDEALNRENLFTIGLASHAFIDTFSHQNFVAIFDEVNSHEGLFVGLKPAIGHSTVGNKPDIPNLIWDDIRMIGDLQEVNNVDRLLLAGQKLYRNYLNLTIAPNKWIKVRDKLKKIIGKGQRNISENEMVEQRELRIEKYIAWLSDFEADSVYDKDKWLKAATNFDSAKLLEVDANNEKKIELTGIEDFEDTDWYHFQSSVKRYIKKSSKLLNPILEQVEIVDFNK